MIAFLRGTVAEAMPQCLVLDVNGVGYEVQVPLSTFDAINPLLLVALIYLTLVIVLTRLLALVERKLAKSDKS